MMKDNATIIAAFKKANKQRRAKLLEKLGFKTADQYFASLTSSVTGSKSKKKAKFTTDEDIVPQDVVIAFDTTGSMATYIASVRKHVEQTINTMFDNTPNLKMKIVAFGDYCDMESATKFGKAYQETQLTDNRQELINFVKTAKNTAGGDPDEFYELVIKKITEETAWRDGGRKSVILIADYTPHSLGYSYGKYVQNNQIDWRVEAKKSAEKGIQWDTLKIIPSHKWYDELSKMTGGVCMDFANSNKIAEVITASTYVRGTTASKAMFTASMDAAVKSGDEELIGAYKSLSSLL